MSTPPPQTRAVAYASDSTLRSMPQTPATGTGSIPVGDYYCIPMIFDNTGATQPINPAFPPTVQWIAASTDLFGGGGSSGVASFNSRTGAVVPVKEDYTGFYLDKAKVGEQTVGLDEGGSAVRFKAGSNLNNSVTFEADDVAFSGTNLTVYPPNYQIGRLTGGSATTTTFNARQGGQNVLNVNCNTVQLGNPAGGTAVTIGGSAGTTTVALGGGGGTTSLTATTAGTVNVDFQNADLVYVPDTAPGANAKAAVNVGSIPGLVGSAYVAKVSDVSQAVNSSLAIEGANAGTVTFGDANADREQTVTFNANAFAGRSNRLRMYSEEIQIGGVDGGSVVTVGGTAGTSTVHIGGGTGGTTTVDCAQSSTVNIELQNADYVYVPNTTGASNVLAAVNVGSVGAIVGTNFVLKDSADAQTVNSSLTFAGTNATAVTFGLDAAATSQVVTFQGNGGAGSNSVVVEADTVQFGVPVGQLSQTTTFRANAGTGTSPGTNTVLVQAEAVQFGQTTGAVGQAVTFNANGGTGTNALTVNSETVAFGPTNSAVGQAVIFNANTDATVTGVNTLTVESDVVTVGPANSAVSQVATFVANSGAGTNTLAVNSETVTFGQANSALAQTLTMRGNTGGSNQVEVFSNSVAFGNQNAAPGQTVTFNFNAADAVQNAVNFESDTVSFGILVGPLSQAVTFMPNAGTGDTPGTNAVQVYSDSVTFGQASAAQSQAVLFNANAGAGTNSLAIQSDLVTVGQASSTAVQAVVFQANSGSGSNNLAVLSDNVVFGANSSDNNQVITFNANGGDGANSLSIQTEGVQVGPTTGTLGQAVQFNNNADDTGRNTLTVESNTVAFGPQNSVNGQTVTFYPNADETAQNQVNIQSDTVLLGIPTGSMSQAVTFRPNTRIGIAPFGSNQVLLQSEGVQFGTLASEVGQEVTFNASSGAGANTVLVYSNVVTFGQAEADEGQDVTFVANDGAGENALKVNCNTVEFGIPAGALSQTITFQSNAATGAGTNTVELLAETVNIGNTNSAVGQTVTFNNNGGAGANVLNLNTETVNIGPSTWTVGSDAGSTVITLGAGGTTQLLTSSSGTVEVDLRNADLVYVPATTEVSNTLAAVNVGSLPTVAGAQWVNCQTTGATTNVPQLITIQCDGFDATKWRAIPQYLVFEDEASTDYIDVMANGSGWSTSTVVSGPISVPIIGFYTPASAWTTSTIKGQILLVRATSGTGTFPVNPSGTNAPFPATEP